MSEIWALTERHEERERREYERSGTIAAAIYNASAGRPGRQLSHKDIFPDAAGAPQAREASGAEIDLFFTGVAAAQQKLAGKNGVAPPARKKVSASEMVGE